MIKKKHLEVSVIIPTYNTRELILENLPEVINTANNSKNKIMEIIVVDDGSLDDTAKVLRERFRGIKVIKHKVNRGFSAAVNTGVRMAKGKYVVLLNSDVRPSENLLVETLPFIKGDDKIFAVSFHTKGWGWVKAGIENGFPTHIPGKETNTPHQTFFINAGGAIYSRDIWKKLGGMDEDLFSPFYWEDVDISYRALKRGYKLFWHPAGIVSANLSATVNKLSKSKVNKIQQRNHLIFIWKDITSHRIMRKHIAGLIKRLIRHPGYIIIVVLTLKKLRRIMKARKKEKRESKVSDESIFAKYS